MSLWIFVWKMYDMHVTNESLDRYFFTLVSCDWWNVCGLLLKPR